MNDNIIQLPTPDKKRTIEQQLRLDLCQSQIRCSEMELAAMQNRIPLVQQEHANHVASLRALLVEIEASNAPPAAALPVAEVTTP